MNEAMQFENGLYKLGQMKSWLAGQFDELVSLLAAFEESDSKMDADEIPVEDGR